MAKYYITVADSMAQATNTFSALQTQPDGGTLSSIKVPPGMKKISVIGTCLTHDEAAAIDTGNNFVLGFTGTGMTDGNQELHAGALCSQETGTSVTGDLEVEPAHYRNVDINVRAGEIVLSAAYDGTDPGSPFIAVTLGFE